MGTTVQLDKTLNTSVAADYGTIAIRVVVLDKATASAPAPSSDEAPLDASPDEMLPETDKKPISTFLEDPKRGRQCCVFLINGQRQHTWDNQFIIRDLELKYLRNRMIVVVDCDGLQPEATAELMRGHRLQFYEGTVYAALEQRVVATLKGDPDLRLLEEEAEEEISSLQAGDEIVKQALDQLIEAHHDAASHSDAGVTEAGSASRLKDAAGGIQQTEAFVIDSDDAQKEPSQDPVIQLKPETSAIRLKPNETRKCSVSSRPESMWKQLETLAVTFDPPVKELNVSRIAQAAGEEISLKFVQPDDFDEDEYPIETVLRATAVFSGLDESRNLERRVVITPPKEKPPKPPVPLKNDPTFIRITSRQPIKIVMGGPDVHVKIRWDGLDELVAGNPPDWIIRATCEAPGVEPQHFLTHPSDGRFELLVQASAGLQAGEQIKFDIEALGPGKTLSTAFIAHVSEPPGPKKVAEKLQGGGQRRPPYELKYVKKEQWENPSCWGDQWTESDPGSFDAPTKGAPLIIYINQDTDMLTSYRDALLAKKLAETTIQQRINRYTAHVAFHLYQMSEKQKQMQSAPDDGGESSSDAQMKDEIQRVAKTLIKLMEVSQ